MALVTNEDIVLKLYIKLHRDTQYVKESTEIFLELHTHVSEMCKETPLTD